MGYDDSLSFWKEDSVVSCRWGVTNEDAWSGSGKKLASCLARGLRNVSEAFLSERVQVEDGGFITGEGLIGRLVLETLVR